MSVEGDAKLPASFASVDRDRGALGRAAGDFVMLTKPRIILLLLVTAFAAMVVAARGMPSVGLVLITLAGLSLSAGGANAVNMWYDRDIDRVMRRTQDRPIPAGRMAPQHALAFGLAAEALSIVILWAFVNIATAAFSFAGFAYYVVIYTMWLKRRTPQNIVIGGAAGAFPPLVGWAAVAGHAAIAAWVMFLIVFLWTPPHFWALALYRNGDYDKAHVPMMPVARGEWVTKWQSLLYTLLLLASSVLLYLTGTVGTLYLVVALVLGAAFSVYGLLLFRERLPEVRWAKRTFRFSLLYLTILFAAMVLNVKG